MKRSKYLQLQLKIFGVFLSIWSMNCERVIRQPNPLEVGFVTFFLSDHFHHEFEKLPGHENTTQIGTTHDLESGVINLHHVAHHFVASSHHGGVVQQHHLVPVSAEGKHVVIASHLNVYRKHPGGYGVGSDSGGQGAGHGFHSIFT